MAETRDGASEAGDEETGPNNHLWELIEDDVRSYFGPDAEISVKHYMDYIELRVMPQDIKEIIETENEDLRAVPCNAFRMTVSKQVADDVAGDD